MLEKFHVNGKGESGLCSAKTKCPFGGVSGQENHFSTPEEARYFYEKNNSNKNIETLNKSQEINLYDEEDKILTDFIKLVNKDLAIKLSLLIIEKDRKYIFTQIKDPKIISKIFTEYSHDLNSMRILASNPYINYKIQNKLLKINDSEINIELSSQRNLSKTAIEFFLKNEDPGLRDYFACNQYLPDSILEKLAKDSDFNVSRAAIESIKRKTVRKENKIKREKAKLLKN